MNKVLFDAVLDDFSDAQFSKENLLAILTPLEMRQLIAVAVKRGEKSDKWLDFALASLPIHDMTLAERRILLDGLLFKSPKAALEFVSKNRDYLAHDEINEITRDYARTVTGDFCLHLSHRNNNWRTKYFSDAQLQIFRGNCSPPGYVELSTDLPARQVLMAESAVWPLRAPVASTEQMSA